MAVCTVEDRGGGTPEVAKVIEAAPELLAALTTLVRLFHGYQGVQLVAAREAIIKATGRDPIREGTRQVTEIQGGKMNPDTLAALLGSIKKWEDIVAGAGVDEGGDNCALCQRFFDTDDFDEEIEDCVSPDGEKCPVAIKAGQPNCSNTPYRDWALATAHQPFRYASASTPELIALAKAELDFLRSLLPTENQSGGEK